MTDDDDVYDWLSDGVDDFEEFTAHYESPPSVNNNHFVDAQTVSATIAPVDTDECDSMNNTASSSSTVQMRFASTQHTAHTAHIAPTSSSQQQPRVLRRGAVGACDLCVRRHKRCVVIPNVGSGCVECATRGAVCSLGQQPNQHQNQQQTQVLQRQQLCATAARFQSTTPDSVMDPTVQEALQRALLVCNDSVFQVDERPQFWLERPVDAQAFSTDLDNVTFSATNRAFRELIGFDPQSKMVADVLRASPAEMAELSELLSKPFASVIAGLRLRFEQAIILVQQRTWQRAVVTMSVDANENRLPHFVHAVVETVAIPIGQ